MTKSQAIKWFGSVSALAKALGVTYEAVRQWDVIPELRQFQIERITGGALNVDQTIPASCHQHSSTGVAVDPSSTSQASA